MPWFTVLSNTRAITGGYGFGKIYTIKESTSASTGSQRSSRKQGLQQRAGVRAAREDRNRQKISIWKKIDITELRCQRSKVYVCGIIDVATRRIVGWSIGKDQTQRLVQNALQMAVGRNPNRPEGAVFHSDRGCQYTAKKTKQMVEKYGFRKSMSRPGTPSDNQPIESFWKTLECEMPDIRHLTFSDASRTISCYIELYYNSSRLHSGINYAIPNQFFTLLSVH